MEKEQINIKELKRILYAKASFIDSQIKASKNWKYEHGQNYTEAFTQCDLNINQWNTQYDLISELIEIVNNLINKEQ